MTATEFRRALSGLDLTPDTFAERLGLHRATVFRWFEKGPPKYAVVILELLQERQAIAARLAK